MRILFLIFSILVTLGLNAQSFQKAKNSAEIKRIIEQKFKATKSLTANFNEETHSSMLTSVTNGKGIVKFQKDENIRWEKTNPKEEIILITEAGIRMQQNGKEITNPSSNRIAKRMKSLMLKMMDGSFLNEKEFSIEYFESNTDYKLKLTPKSTRLRNYVQTIELIFDKGNLSMDNLTIFESDSDFVKYSFTNVKFNSTIPNSTFTQF